MSLSKNLIKNALSNYTGMLVSAVVGLFVSPFIIHHLGDSAYGLWALFQSVFGYFGLLDLGLGFSIVKYISEYKAKGDQQDINIFGSTIFFTYIVIGIMVFILSLFFAPFITVIFHIPMQYNNIAFYAVIISGATTAIVFPMSFIINTLSAHQRYEITNLIGIIRSLIYAVSVVIMLKYGSGLLSLFILNLVLLVITLSIGYYLVVLKYKFLSIKLSSYDFNILKMAYKYSIFAFLNNISGQALLNIGNIIIGAILTIKFVTYYALAFRINTIIAGIMSSVVAVTLPVYSSLWAVNDKEKIKFTYLEVTKAIMLISLPVSIVAIIFSESIMSVWVGQGYHLASLSIIALAIVLFIHYIGGYVPSILLFGISKHKALSIANAIAAAANLILAVVLTKWIDVRYGTGYGVLGIPIALGLTMGSVDIFFLPWYVNRIIELPNRQYLKSFIRPVLFIIPAMIAALLIKHYYEPPKLIIFILESAIVGLIYWGLYYMFGLTKVEKERYIGYMKQFVK